MQYKQFNHAVVRHYEAAVQRTRMMETRGEFNHKVAMAHEMQVAQRMGAAEWDALYTLRAARKEVRVR